MRTRVPSANDGIVEALQTEDVGKFSRMHLKSLSRRKLQRYSDAWLRSSPKVRLFMGFTNLSTFPDNERIRTILAEDIIKLHQEHGGLPLSYGGIRFTVPVEVFIKTGCEGKQALFDVVYSLDAMRFSQRVDVEELKSLDIVLTLRDKKDYRISGWLAVRQLQKYANLRVGEQVSSSVSFNGVRPEQFLRDVDEYMATLEPQTRVTASKILLEQSFCALPRLRKFWFKGGI